MPETEAQFQHLALLGREDPNLLVQELHLFPGHDLVGDDVRLAPQHIDQHNLVAFAVVADGVVDRHLAAAALGDSQVHEDFVFDPNSGA